jgi:hypothetical protein
MTSTFPTGWAGMQDEKKKVRSKKQEGIKRRMGSSLLYPDKTQLSPA